MEFGNGKVIIGHRHEWGGSTPIDIDIAERRQHLYLIGQSGTGKSTLLRNLILSDIEAGRGVALIDHHGDLADEILDYIPSRRIADVVYFDPMSSHPPAINLFRATGGSWHVVASGIVSSF